MDWKNKILQPHFRQILCAILSGLILVSLLVPGIPLEPMEEEDPLAQQEIREIEAVRLGDEADGSNAIIIPVEGDETAEQSLEVTEGEGMAGEGEAQTGERRPEELLPVEVEGDEIDQEKTDTGSGDQGQEDGNSGEEGGELIQPDLAAVMVWKRYGTGTTVVCTPYQTVAATVNMAQLEDDLLEYEFYLTGTDATDVKITSVTVSSGNDLPRETDIRGQMKIELPEGEDSRTCFFWVEAEGKDADGEPMDVSFTYVLKCENRLDLSLALDWKTYDGETKTVTCRADDTANRTVDSGDLEGGVFTYTPRLTGSKADGAELISGKYTTLSGETGTLDVNGGTLQLTIPEGVDAQIYDLFFEARLGERIVSYKISLHYRDVLSVRLNVTWFAGDTVPSSKICQSGDTVDYTIRASESRNGSARFELKPEGEDAAEAVFLSVSYQGSDGSGGVLNSSQGPAEPYSFLLPVALGSGGANTYTVTAVMLADGKNLTYTIRVRYASDMSLEMTYTLNDGTQQQIVCESGDDKKAEAIHEDQLTDGMLHYTMTVRNAEGESVPIDKIFCYQSGDLTSKGPLKPEGSIALLMKDKKTGENTFTVTARDGGREHTFKINIPYKPRGSKTVHFWTSLQDGDDVINDIVNNFSVRAWVEDENGNPRYIRNGTESHLTVKMDGETVISNTHAGSTMEYDLVPKNPETGDTNLHTILIDAEDEEGNNGTLELILRGNRRMPGQVLGKATIRVDLAVLGKGIESVEYTVLTNEPASISIAKAVWGHDYGEPFGRADQTLGWSDGKYEGELEEGFYLSRLYYGGSVGAEALEGDSWTYGWGTGSEELQYEIIDSRFGQGSALASLWRCLYRNQVEKSEGAEDMIGEFLYTLGSGWTYFLNGSTFPGEGMDQYFLRDGDVLTLAYTLAYGWEIGSGVEDREGPYGYCVRAENGRLSVNHNWVEEDGYSECTHCGLKTYCTHPGTDYRKVDAYYHEKYCTVCDMAVDSDLPHIWSESSATDPAGHSCKDCDYTTAHSTHETSDTAYCDKEGSITESCWYCSYTHTEVLQKEHNFVDGNYAYTDEVHWQFCNLPKSTGGQCNEPGPVTEHYFDYKGTMEVRDNQTGEEFSIPQWKCACGLIHGIDICEAEMFMTPAFRDDKGSDFVCGICGRSFHADHIWHDWETVEPDCTEDGYRFRWCDYCFFEAEETIPAKGHSFADGFCTVCGESDPDHHEHNFADGFCECGEADPDYVPSEEGGEESGEEELSLFARLQRTLPGRTIWEERI